MADKKKKSYSIRQRLKVSILALAITPLLLLGVILSIESYILQLNEIEIFQEELTIQESKNISSFFHEQDEKIITILNNNYFPELSYKDQKNIISKFLASSRDDFHGYIFTEIAFTDEKGLVKVRVSRSQYIDPADFGDYSKTNEFIVPAASGKRYYSPVYFDKKTGIPLMKVGYPIKDLHSLALKGVLIVEIKLDSMTHLVQSLKIGKNGNAYLTSADGKVIAHKNHTLILKDTYFKAPKSTSIMRGLNGQINVVAAAKIDLNGTSFYFVTELPLREAFSYLFSIIVTIAILLFFSLAGAVALEALLIRQIVKPIEKLAQVAGKIEKDGMEYAEVGSNDELGKLAEAFNTMTSRLLKTITNLKAEQNFINNTFEAITHPLYVIDANDYTVKMANSVANFGKLTMDSKCYALTHNSDTPCRKCPIDIIKKTGKSVVLEHVHIDKDSKQKSYIEIFGYPIFDDNGDVVQIIEYSIDITEKKQLEDQLRQVQKMESIGSLSGAVAHDFNNYLSAIIGYSELILMNLPADSPLRNDIESINEAGLKGASLTQQLLAFSRKQLMEIKIINLNDLINKMMEMLGKLIGEHIELKMMLSSDIENIKVDPSQIEQVVMNLIVNARDAMKNGGRLIIETSNIDLNEEYCNIHAEVAPGPYVMLVVTDNGHGFTQKVKERIFEPFFTTKDVGKGTGLGLSTIYGIIKQLKGHIFVYSEVGKGTTFKIFFPAIKENVKKTFQKSTQKRWEGKETILVIDDNQTIRLLAKKILEHFGYKVIMAETCNKVIELCKDKATKIDLLLTDIIMPDMNGQQLAEKVKFSRPNLKVLFMSGYTDNVITYQTGIEAGFFFIAKPLSPEELASKIRSVLDS